MTALPFAYSLQADGSATATRHPGTLDNAQLCSGAGQFHTNEPDPSNPGKRLTPYNPITWQDVLALVDTPQQVDKGAAQWLIPSTLHSRSFAAQEQRGEYWALWFDLDTAPPSADALLAAMPEVIGVADFEVYSSRSATPELPKWRGLIPLSEPLSGGDWALAQEAINDRLEAQGITPDRVSQRTAQLCYLPNRGEHYQSHSKRDGVRFNALAELGAAIEAKRQQQREAEARLGAEREAAAAKRASLRMADAPDAIGAFNRAYSVQEVLAQAGYKQRGNTFCHPNSASGSYSASVRDGRVHTLSGSDPLYTGGGGGGAHDAFSAFTVLFNGGDCGAALRDAGDNWLSVGGESWNKAKQREWAQQQSGAAPGDFWHLSDGTLPQGIAPAAAMPEGAPPRLPFDIEAARITPAWFTLPPPPRLWLVRDLIPRGVVGVLAAVGGGFKSTFAQWLALSIASGLPFLGHEIDTPGAVVYLSAEDDREELQRRLYAIGRHVGAVDHLDTEAVARNLYMFDLVAYGFKLTQPTQEGGRQITINAHGIEQLKQAIQAIGDVRLVVVDTYSRFNGGEENDNGHSATFVTACEQIRQGVGCNVLVTAHTTKAGSSTSGPVKATDVAGGARLVDAARWMAGLDRYMLTPGTDPSDEKMRHVRLTVGKSNYGCVGATYWLEYQNGALVQHAERVKPPQKEEAKQEKEKSADARYRDVLGKLRSFLMTKSAEGEYFTERALRPYAGKEGIFGVGETTLRTIIARAKEEGELFIHKVGNENRLAIWKQHGE